MLWSCGCNNGSEGSGLDASIGTTSYLWVQESAPDDIGLDFEMLHKLESSWCKIHGPEFCEVIVTGKRVED